MVGARQLHGGRVKKSSSTWPVSKWPAWEINLGGFRAEFGHGPKMKFAQLVLLYIYCLRCTAIRVID